MSQPAAPPALKIFISYRRDDSGGYALHLFEHLSAHFGKDQIFMDIERIDPGEDFVQVIEQAVGSCDVLIALIGRQWLTITDGTARRLDNPHDFVRLEIAAALNRNVRVIPVLVQGAAMPGPQDLPDALTKLSRRNAFELSDRRWRHDVHRLIDKLEEFFAKQQEARRREAEEAEARRREAEAEAIRQREAEEQRQRVEEERRIQEAQVARAAEEARQLKEAEERQRREAEAQRKQEEERERLNQEAAEAERQRQETEGSARRPGVAPVPVAVEETPSAAGAEGDPTRNAKSARPAVQAKRIGLAALSVVAALVLIAAGVFAVRKIQQQRATPKQQATPSPSVLPQSTPTVKEPREPPAPPGMVYVPGGEFQMGNDAGDEYERPAHTVMVNPFFIDQYEVTNEEYAEFVKETNHKPPQTWRKGRYPDGTARHPVTGVTWDDANDYAKLAGKRLPTEEEWELAARGTDGRRYPWDNEWRVGLANADGAASDVVDVGSYQAGKSPFGVFDMVGNAWEWTAGNLQPYPNGQLPKQKVPLDTLKVFRGGSYYETKEQATTTYRRGYPMRGAPEGYRRTGFRCAKDIAHP